MILGPWKAKSNLLQPGDLDMNLREPPNWDSAGKKVLLIKQFSTLPEHCFPSTIKRSS